MLGVCPAPSPPNPFLSHLGNEGHAESDHRAEPHRHHQTGVHGVGTLLPQVGHGDRQRRQQHGRHGADNDATRVVHGRKCHCACLPGQEEAVAEQRHLEEDEDGQPGRRGWTRAGVDAGQLCLCSVGCVVPHWYGLCEGGIGLWMRLGLVVWGGGGGGGGMCGCCLFVCVCVCVCVCLYG